MKVSFRTRQLERAFEQSDRAVRLWGDETGRRYVTRIIQLMNARDFDDIRVRAALRAHQLKGDRKGEWALNLAGRWRLIVEVAASRNEVTVVEVSKHYGD